MGCCLSNPIGRKLLTFEEYWLASKAWERRGLTLGTTRALVNALVTLDDLYQAHALELATIPRVGRKSSAVLMQKNVRVMGTPRTTAS